MPADRSQLYQYKGNCCAVCGTSVGEIVKRWGTFERLFHFHHIDPESKAGDYDNLIRRNLSTEQLDEVDKCALLCVECHAIVHAQNLPATLHATVTFAGRSAEQIVKGHAVIDHVTHIGRFVTNEECLLHPYYVFRGNREPEVLFGTELRHSKLVELMRSIAEYKHLVIRAISGRLMYVMEHLEGDTFRAKQNICFNVPESELMGDTEDEQILWVRKGVGITIDGQVLRDHVITMEGVLVR